MNPNLKALLEHLSATLDAARQAEVEGLHRRARLVAYSNPRSVRSSSFNPR